MKDPDINYSLSSLAIAYLNAERLQTMTRDLTRTSAREPLEALLAMHGLPMSPSIWDFEKHLGGWCSSNQMSEHGLGVYLSLQEGDGCSKVATELRRRTWIFEGECGRPDEDGEISPLWGTGYPRAFFLDRPLVPAGMNGLDEYFFLGESGEVYNWVSPLGQLVVEAGSGRTFLESRGLNHQKSQSWFEAHICADLGSVLATELSLTLFEQACDQLFQWWASDTMQIRLVPNFAPCISGTHLACANEKDFLRVMRMLQAALGVKRVRVWKRGNLINDQRGFDALSRAGIDCEILRGPGPGHGSDEYDVSLCDPKNWT